MHGLGTVWLALGLAADAFAAALCQGLAADRITPGRMVWTGVWFGGAQGLMPLLGWLLGLRFAAAITAADHWIAFGLLTALGVNLILEALQKEAPAGASFSVREMLLLALATSIDALAVGLTFAALGVDPRAETLCIALITGGCSAAGLALGHRFGLKGRTTAQLLGGFILIVLGVKILWEHTHFAFLG